MWKTRRRAVALLGSAATLLLPFLEVRGRSAFRFDLPTLSLHFFGAVLPIDEFFLVLLAAIFLLFLTVATTVAFGRLWCGWLCPQTVIGEIGEWIASALPARFRPAGRKVALLPLSALVSFSLLGYFVPPAEAARGLFRSPVLSGFFLVQWGAIYGMTAIVGARFCRTVCPYAMLQNALADRETISVAYDPSRGGCLECERCVRVCPVKIDIRRGPRRECIACAECIDACRDATARPGIPPFIGYRGTVVRGKSVFLAGAAASAAVVLLAALSLRPDVRFSIQWDGKAAIPGANVYRYSARNDTDRVLRLSLSVEAPARLLSDPAIEVPPRARIVGRVTVNGGEGAPGEVRFTANGTGFRSVAKAAFP
ncbi:MAG: hypothetical protein OHK0028_07960 [Deltaproteobacteria bacterium]